MRFHDYLEQIFSVPTSISLIKALVRYRGKVFTIRGLSRVAHVSPSQSALITKKLEKLGVVRVQPVGRSALVSLNEESYILNRIMRPMIRAEEGTLNELLSVLRRNLGKDKIVSAILFGSISRREEREDSDIDLLVISNDFEYASRLLSKAGEQVYSIFCNRLSPMIMSERELRLKRKSDLLKSIEASHTNVAGRPLEEILKREND